MLWRAELGAWLHNVGKFCSAFQTRFGTAGSAGPGAFHPEAIVGRFRAQIEGLNWKDNDGEQVKRLKRWDGSQPIFSKWYEIFQESLRLPEPFNKRDYQIGDFIELSNATWYRSDHLKEIGIDSSYLTELLYVCHQAASAEKDDFEGQDPTNHKVSPFGFGRPATPADVVESARGELLKATKLERREFLTAAKPLLMLARAETRWPANDIDMWDFSSSVAAFFRAAMVKCVLEERWPGRESLGTDFAWRLVRVGIDGPEFYGRVARLPDLLARRTLMKRLLDAAQRVLEDEVGIASEIYRDEHGATFLAPNLLGDENGDIIRREGEPALTAAWVRESSGELLPFLEILPAPTETLFPSRRPPKPGSTRDQLVGKALALGPGLALKPGRPLVHDPATVASWWKETKADVCPVCGLRPQGPSKRSRDRKVCDTCEIRREGRSRTWLSSELHQTIWLEEVADVHGRIALVCGRFQIDDWLAVNPEVWGAAVPASFARMRRVWQTTRQFWDEITRKAAGTIPKGSQRIEIEGTFRANETDTLGISQTYLFRSVRANDGVRFSFVCRSGGILLSAENLKRAAELAGLDEEEVRRAGGSAEALVNERFAEGDEFEVEVPTGYGKPNKSIGRFRVGRSKVERHDYSRVIEVCAEPRSFQLLTPASDALRVLELIQEKYDAEMGKVAHRLPIQLGVVFASAATPLYALLDAARRMSERRVLRETWTLKSKELSGDDACEFHFTNGAQRRVALKFPDGEDDQWYPFFRQCNEEWVHAKDLVGGEEIQVRPSFFDFEFLDVVGRRFEIAYDEKGRRSGRVPQPQKPYPLHRLRTMLEVWTILQRGLATSQIQFLRGLLAEKKQAWGSTGETYRELARSAIRRVHWDVGLTKEQQDLLYTAIQEDFLLDTIELHMGILKLKGNAEERQEATTQP
jgi:hypothetical protein